MAEDIDNIVAGFGLIFERVAGLPIYNAAGDPVNILDYEPKSIQATPTIYTISMDADTAEAGNMVSTVYHFLHRLCWKWQDNQYAEREIRPFHDLIIKAVEADPQLAGVLPQGAVNNGHARIEHYDDTFTPIGGILYRTIDFRSRVVCKRARVPRFIP